jgi:hypothetical protein
MNTRYFFSRLFTLIFSSYLRLLLNFLLFLSSYIFYKSLSNIIVIFTFFFLKLVDLSIFFFLFRIILFRFHLRLLSSFTLLTIIVFIPFLVYFVIFFSPIFYSPSSCSLKSQLQTLTYLPF